MSDLMLHGVLNMTPDLWRDSSIDQDQRWSRYVEASKKIKELEAKIRSCLEILRAQSDEHTMAEDCYGCDEWASILAIRSAIDTLEKGK